MRGDGSPASLRRGRYQRSETAIQRLLAEAGVAGFGDGRRVDRCRWPRSRSRLGQSEDRRKPTSATTATQNFASRGGADLDRRRVYAAPARLALNQWALAGEWTMGRQVDRPEQVLMGGSSTAFTRATFISSWGRYGENLQYVFACRSTGSRQARPTASTLTRAAMAQ